MKICLICGKEFKTYPYLTKKGCGKYCSRLCFLKTKNEKIIKRCIVCRKKFSTYHYFTSKGCGKFCSTRCYGRYRYNNKMLPPSQKGRISPNRGKKYPQLAGENNPNWKGGKTTESEKVRKSLEYKLWREVIFERDNYTCQWCGAKNGQGKTVKLNADHINPFSLYPELRLAIDNGRTLCENCHKKTTSYLTDINKWERVAFFTVVSDDYYYAIGTPKFINSFLYFHPDKNIDLIIFRQDIIDSVFSRYGLNFYNARPTFAKLLLRDGYGLVVGIDADTVILGRLDEVLAKDYEVGCSSNFNDFENRSIENVGEKEFVQAGLVASRNPKFWDIWERENKKAMEYVCKENDILSLIWKNDLDIQKMKKKVFDENKNYYGCKSLGREGEFYIEKNQVMCRKEKVVCYHHAKGLDFPKLQFERMGFTWEVTNFMNMVSNSGTSFKIKGI